MTAVRLPRPAAFATVLVLLAAAIVAFPRNAHGQVGGRVVTPDGVPPTASTVLVTVKGPDTPEATRPAVGGRFSFPSLERGTKVTVQAMAQGLVSNPVAATAPDTMVVLVLRPMRAGEKFDIVQQGAQNRARTADTPAAQPTPAGQPAPESAAPSAAPEASNAPAAANAAANAPALPPLNVQDAILTTAELVNREPVAASACTSAACSSRFPATVGTITFWTRITGGSPGRWIEHVWLWEGEEIARVRQKVEASAWRTWTRKRIQTDWDGEWRVEVRGEDGALLAERSFTIEKQ
jgi:Protein of unknown function (DUF2914)